MVLSSRQQEIRDHRSKIQHNVARSARPLPIDRWVHVVASYTANELHTLNTAEGKSSQVVSESSDSRIEIYFNGQRSASTSIVGNHIPQLGRPFHIGMSNCEKSSMFNNAAKACKKWNCKGSVCALIAGVAWHDNGLRMDDAANLSCMPSPSALAKKNIASEYSYRLCGLLLSLVNTEIGIRILSQDHKWMSLLLEMLRNTSVHVQRCILRIITLVLPEMQPSSVSAPAIKIAVGTGHSAASAGRGALGLWQYLSNIAGVAWWCSSSHTNSGVCGNINSVLSQFLPEYLSPNLSQALKMASAENFGTNTTHSLSAGSWSADMYEHNQENNQGDCASDALLSSETAATSKNKPASTTSHQEKIFGVKKSSFMYAVEQDALSSRNSLISDITLLFRDLLGNSMWKQSIIECLGKALSRCYGDYREYIHAKREFVDIASNDLKLPVLRRLDMGEAILAVNILGGMIEQPYVGMKVQLPDRLNRAAPIELRGAFQAGYLASNINGSFKSNHHQATVSVTPRPIIGTIISIDWTSKSACIVIPIEVSKSGSAHGKELPMKNFDQIKSKLYHQQKWGHNAKKKVTLPLSHITSASELGHCLLPEMGHTRIAQPLVGMCILALDPQVSIEELPPISFSPVKKSPMKRASTSEVANSATNKASPSKRLFSKSSSINENDLGRQLLESEVVWNQLSTHALRALGNILRLPSVAAYALKQKNMLASLMKVAISDIAATASNAVSITQNETLSFDKESSTTLYQLLGLSSTESLPLTILKDQQNTPNLTEALRTGRTHELSSRPVSTKIQLPSQSSRLTASISSPAVMLSAHLKSWLSVPSLEQMNELAWSRLHSADLPMTAQQVLQRPRLERLGGVMKIDQSMFHVHSSSNFPSVRLGMVSLQPSNTAESHSSKINDAKVKDIYSTSSRNGNLEFGSITGGCWFYEVTLLTNGLMQIGWADALYKGDPDRGQGVGDHPHSWAIDGYRCKKWNSSSDEYGKRWHAADVIGCLLDLDAMKMQFYLNGEDLGVAYTDFHQSGGLYPAISLNMDQAARFNFGPPHGEFVFPPTDDYPSYSPISDAFTKSISIKKRSKYGEKVSEQTFSHLEKKSEPYRVDESNESNVDQDDTSVTVSNNGFQLSSLQQQEAAEAELKLQNDELVRQAMIDNLIGMGFPVEWCVRAANHHFSGDMDESSAIAWIIEQMEMESESKGSIENEDLDDLDDDLDSHQSEDSHDSSADNDIDEEDLGNNTNGGHSSAAHQQYLQDEFINSQYGSNSQMAEHFQYLSSAIRHRIQNNDNGHDSDSSELSEITEDQLNSEHRQRLSQSTSSAISNNASSTASSHAISTTQRVRYSGPRRVHQKDGANDISDPSSANDVAANHLLLLEEECDELYMPGVGNFFALHGDRSNLNVRSGTGSTDSYYESLSIMSLIQPSFDQQIIRAAATEVTKSPTPSSSPSISQKKPMASLLSNSDHFNGTNRSNSPSEPLHSLAQTNDLQELWGLGMSASAALLVVYARSCLISILQVQNFCSENRQVPYDAIFEDDEDEEEAPLVAGDEDNADSLMHESGSANPETVLKSFVLALCKSGSLIMFINFLKLVRYRGPLLYTSRISSTADISRNLGGNPSTDSEPCEQLQWINGDTYKCSQDAMSSILTPILKILLTFSHNYSRQNVSTSTYKSDPSLLVTLLDEALVQMSNAGTREFDRTMWLSSPVSFGGNPMASRVFTLKCDSDTLGQPNPLWAAWVLNAVMDEVSKKFLSGENIHLTQEVFSISIYSKLMKSAMVSHANLY